MSTTLDGKPPISGHLEVKFGGAWGAICDTRSSQTQEFNGVTGTVLCRKLGYTGTGIGFHYSDVNNDQMWLGGISCSSAQSSLAECTHEETDLSSCQGKGGLGLACYSSESEQVLLKCDVC